MAETLPAAAEDGEVHRLLTGASVPTLATIALLKDQSAAHYFDEPGEALRIAGVAYRLGQTLTPPAPALGKWALANAYLFANRYSEAVALFEIARREYLADGLELDAARMGVGQVWGLAYAGRFAEAQALAEQVEPMLARAARKDPEDLRRLGSLYNNWGILCELTGSYEQALEIYDRRLAIAQEQGSLRDVARTQHNRVLLFMKLNALEEALAASREAESGFTAADMKVDLGRLFLNRGLLMADWGRLDEAEEAFRRADAILAPLDGMEQQRQAATVFGLLARMQAHGKVDAGDIAALGRAQQALAVQGPVFQEALAWIGLGRCHLQLGEVDAARSAFAEALRLGEERAGRSIRVLAYHGLAGVAEAQGQWEQAIACCEAAIQQAEALRHDLHVESFRAGFLADKLVVYQDLAHLLVQLGRYHDAYAVTEQGRARVLSERLTYRLQEAPGKLAAPGDTAARLQEELQQVFRQMRELQAAARLAEEMSGEGGEALAHDEVRSMEALEDRVVQLTRELERADPRLNLTGAWPGPGSQPASLPLGDAVLVQYYVDRDHIGVFVVDAEGALTHRPLAGVHQVAAPASALRASLERFLTLTTAYDPRLAGRYLPMLLRDAQASLAELHRLLLAPLADLIQDHPQLVISPDGPLHQVPFQALYDGTSFLIERQAVSYTPSAAILALCSQAAPLGSGSLIAGYGGEDLPGALSEIDVVRRHAPNAVVLRGEDATAARFLEEVGHSLHIHIASHARFRQDNMMLSALALADRRLTFAEIARLRLQSDLVVLSGCETGSGRALGTDVMSLANGFLGAGARSLLVSLWRVDDATTVTFMDRLYHHVAAEPNRAQALRQAQLDLLTQGRQAAGGPSALLHPASWAPFILLGSWLPISTPLELS